MEKRKSADWAHSGSGGIVSNYIICPARCPNCISFDDGGTTTAGKFVCKERNTSAISWRDLHKEEKLQYDDCKQFKKSSYPEGNKKNMEFVPENTRANNANTTFADHKPKPGLFKKKKTDVNVGELSIPKRKSKIIAYFLGIILGWAGAHQVYLAQISKKPYRQDNWHVLRGLPFPIGWVALIVGFKKSFDDENGFFQWLDRVTTGGNANFFTFLKDSDGFKLIFLGLAIIIVFWIIDLLTLGKQVDRWNIKHV